MSLFTPAQCAKRVPIVGRMSMADPSWYVPRAAFQRRSPANESVVRLTVTVSGRRDERDVIPRARRRGPIQSAYPFIARHLRRPASGILDSISATEARGGSPVWISWVINLAGAVDES